MSLSTTYSFSSNILLTCVGPRASKLIYEMVNADVSDVDTTSHGWTTSSDGGLRLTSSPAPAAAYEREKTVFEEVTASSAGSSKKSRHEDDVDDDSRTRSFYFRQGIVLTI